MPEAEEDGVGGGGQQGDGLDLVEALAEGMGDAHRRRARVPHRPGKRRVGGRRYYTWAELLRRVYCVDVFTCPRCGGTRRLLAAIQDPDSIKGVLRAMGLPCDAPELAEAGACGLTHSRRGGIGAWNGPGGSDRRLFHLHAQTGRAW